MLGPAVLLLALAVDPHLLERLYEQAQREISRGNLEAAMDCLNRITSAKPDIPEIENLLGVMCSRKGDIAAAEQHFRKALSIQPHYPEARENLALFLARHGRFPEAIAEYANLLEQEPGLWYSCDLGVVSAGRRFRSGAAYAGTHTGKSTR